MKLVILERDGTINAEGDPYITSADDWTPLPEQLAPHEIAPLIASPLRAIAQRANVRLVAIGANAAQVAGLPIDVRPWSEATEVAELAAIDIGIMPLPDEPFERGKCGYKLIQYMACGRPVVASPVGVNTAIVRDGVDLALEKWERRATEGGMELPPLEEAQAQGSAGGQASPATE